MAGTLVGIKLIQFLAPGITTRQWKLKWKKRLLRKVRNLLVFRMRMGNWSPIFDHPVLLQVPWPPQARSRRLMIQSNIKTKRAERKLINILNPTTPTSPTLKSAVNANFQSRRQSSNRTRGRSTTFVARYQIATLRSVPRVSLARTDCWTTGTRQVLGRRS